MIVGGTLISYLDFCLVVVFVVLVGRGRRSHLFIVRLGVCLIVRCGNSLM